jgi:acetyl esterase/lipase
MSHLNLTTNIFKEKHKMFSSKQSPIIIGLVLLIVASLIAGCAGATTPVAAPTATPAAAQPAAPAGMPPLPAGAVPPAGGPPAGGPPASAITPTLPNIAYANTSSAQVLDLYMPEGTGPFPLVVNIHPGGFFTGDKGMIPVTPTLAMLAAGYAVASVNYRLSSEAPFPAAVQDVKAAVRFLRVNAAKYNLNPDQIAAFGQSAGGNLASILGTSSDIAAFDDPALGNAGVSSRVQAVINWFGPNDFSQLDEQAKAQGCAESDQTHSAADSPESKYLGAAVPTVPELVKQANPITYITPDDPAFLIQKGDQDCTIAIENTKMLADALSAAKMDVQYELLKGVGHGDGFGSTTPVFESDANSQKLVDFLNAQLKNAASSAAPVAEPTLSVMPARGGPGGGMTPIKATPIVKDAAYATASPTQKLDLYVPAGNGPFPLIINIHGGGFMMGDKSNPPLTDELLAAGYAVASIDYRLSGEAKFPAAVQDAKAALRFLRAHAAEYKLNPDKFGAYGGSAGGNLAAMLGTSCGVKELEGAELGNADQSSCVQAVVDWFGPTDFLQMDKQFAGTSCPVNHDAADSPESQYVGAPIQTVPDKAKAANPITYVSPTAPPFFIEHGTADCNVPPQQGKLLADALTPAIGADKVTYTLLDGAGHGGAQFSEAANVKGVIEFLDKYLK